MKKALLLPVAGLILALVFAIPMVAGANGGDVTAELYAGQDIDAGDVNVSYDSVTGNLTVEFKVVTENWTLAETHVHVATSLEDIPQTKKGNPIPGKFDYSKQYSPCEQAPDPYVIPLEWDYGETVYIAAHAKLRTHTISSQHTQGDGTHGGRIRLEKPCGQRESAWGAGFDFPGKNWAMYFAYTVQGHPTFSH